MLYSFKKGKNATETHICAGHGEGAVTDRMCQKWFARFRAGDFSLDDAPRPGRPVEGDSGRIKTLTESNPCSTTRARAHTLKLSKSIKLLVKMKNVSFILWKKLNGFLATQYIVVTA